MPRTTKWGATLPLCPGCSAHPELFQPLENEPVRLIAVCTNEDCRVVAVFDLLSNGNWVIQKRMVTPPVGRIPSAAPRLRARARTA